MTRRLLRLRVDPILCDGRGLCAALLPELVGLDDWGFPIVSVEPVAPARLDEARAAVRACPKLALSLVPAELAVRRSDGGVSRPRPG